MRIAIPPIRQRKSIQKNLEVYFDTHKLPYFNRAIKAICKYYKLPTPVVEWYEYLRWGTVIGLTHENGKIHLVHPENWKKGRKYNTMEQWINAVYHELGHYILWTDPERKADKFAEYMSKGVK
jgi:hypothetical protein